MLIAIPSKGRAGKTTSNKIISSAVFYVPEIEADDYQKVVSNKVIGVPEAIRGITKTRNYILDTTDNKRVVMIDDDVKTCGYRALRDGYSVHKNLSEKEFISSFERLFDITEDLKYRIWGISTNSALRAVLPFRPFIFHAYVTASCMGIINDGKTRFDEKFQVKEDYELCLRCIKEDGGVLAARYLYWENSHWTDDGGCKDYRTQALEHNAIKMLLEMYPGMIKRVTRGGSQYSIDLSF